MIPVHYRDGQESPIGRCEVDTVKDIDKAIIDAFKKRWVVKVGDDGTVSCQTCDDRGCRHEKKILERLRSITDMEKKKTEKRSTPSD